MIQLQETSKPLLLFILIVSIQQPLVMHLHGTNPSPSQPSCKGVAVNE